MAVKGVGTIITETLSAFGITGYVGCGCAALATKMNEAGPEKVQKELDYYTEQMKISINKWRDQHYNLIPPPPEFVIRKFISYACEKSLSTYPASAKQE